MGGLMYIVIRKYTKVRSVADAARRAKSGIVQILRELHGFRSYYVLDGGEGVGVAVMIFEDRESANAANEKVLGFVKASCVPTKAAMAASSLRRSPTATTPM